MNEVIKLLQFFLKMYIYLEFETIKKKLISNFITFSDVKENRTASSNSQFADRCPGISKYLQVVFSCKLI